MADLSLPPGYHIVPLASAASAHFCTQHKKFWLKCIRSTERDQFGEFWAVDCPLILIERDEPGEDEAKRRVEASKI